MTSSPRPFTPAANVNAFRDAAALARALTTIHAQTCAPELIKQVNNSPAPLRFDHDRSRTVLYATNPVECNFLPASGMLLHLPLLRRLKRPVHAYFLDQYDIALGLAVKEAGAGVWMVPALELSLPVGSKVTLTKNGRVQVFSEIPESRAPLLHRNSAHLYLRTARGFDKDLAVGWLGRGAVLQAWRFITYGFDQRWNKAAAALTGWALGLFGFAPGQTPADMK